MSRSKDLPYRECEICGVRFSANSALREHYRNHRKNDPTPKFTGYRVVEEKAFPVVVEIKLTRDKRTYHWFACSVCGKRGPLNMVKDHVRNVKHVQLTDTDGPMAKVVA